MKTPQGGFVSNLTGFVVGSAHYGQNNNLSAVNWYDFYMGNMSPGLPVDWGDHAVCWYENGGTVIILDPSYGTIAVGNSLADAESSWERASVTGFCWVWFTITNNTPVRTFYPYNTIRTMYKTNGPLLIWTNQ